MRNGLVSAVTIALRTACHTIEPIVTSPERVSIENGRLRSMRPAESAIRLSAIGSGTPLCSRMTSVPVCSTSTPFRTRSAAEISSGGFGVAVATVDSRPAVMRYPSRGEM